MNMYISLRRLLFVALTFNLLLAACGPQAAPTANPVEVQASAAAMALTMVAQTQAAIPTATDTPIPTDTPTLLPTSTPNLTPLATPTLFIRPTNTAAYSGEGCNHPIATWEVPSTKLILSNQTKESIVLSLSVFTPLEECGYLGYSFKNSTSVIVPIGCYSAWAWVGNKTTLNSSFCLSEQSWSLLIKDDRMILQAGCAGRGGC